MNNLLVFWAFCGVVGFLIGSGKRMGGGNGFLLGCLLGPLGLIIVAVSAGPSTLERVEARGGDEAGWHPDPLGRFDSRYWDGQRWTQHVGRIEADGTRRQFEDPT